MSETSETPSPIPTPVVDKATIPDLETPVADPDAPTVDASETSQPDSKPAEQPDVEASSNPSLETARPVGVTPERQSAEIQSVAHTVIERRTLEALARRRAREELTGGDKYLAGLADLEEFLAGNNAKKEQDLRSGNHVMVDYHGEKVRVTKIIIESGGKVKYEIYKPGPTREDDTSPFVYDIAPEAIIDAQYVTEGKAIADLFTGDIQQVIKLDIKIKSGDTSALAPENAAQRNSIIENAAQSAGRVPAKDLTTLIGNLYKDSEVADAALKQLEGKNVLDGQTFRAIIAQDNENGAFSAEQVDNIVTMIDSGKIDLNKAQEMRAAIQSGDVGKVISSIIVDNPSDSAEQKAAKDKQREMLLNIAKGTGVGLGVLLLFVLSAMSEGAKGIK